MGLQEDLRAEALSACENETDTGEGVVRYACRVTQCSDATRWIRENADKIDAWRALPSLSPCGETISWRVRMIDAQKGA